MIESIHICKSASYDNNTQSMADLSKHNFLYGANGTGKTTISKVIASEGEFPECSVVWQGGTPLKTCVYNCDFVEKNFNQTQELKGIFTLGEKDVETIAKIDATKHELDELRDDITKLNQTLAGEDGQGGKKGELQELNSLFEKQCWELKKEYDDKFLDAFTGARNSSAKFKERLLSEAANVVDAGLPLEELEKKAGTVFGEVPQTAIALDRPETEVFLAHEANPILQKKVIGKTDVDIAALILKLGNSDWVNEGRQYYDPENKLCPFCQQKTDEKLEEDLNSYFDGAYELDSKSIESLYINYKTDSERLQQSIQALLDNPSTFLNIEAFQSEKNLLDANIRINVQRIEEKKRESSKTVELDSAKNICDKIQQLVENANDKVRVHNEMVKNLDAERKSLIKQVWKYLLENEIGPELKAYRGKKQGLEAAIQSLTEQVEKKKKLQREKTLELRGLERDTTSIQPTIDGINELLKAFGFHGFMLAKSDQKRFYKIVRPDGSDAKKTLSEGEKTFITFLYFYHLLKGSEEESGMTTDRVVVIDDPVSSLDSDILFIVSSLIKQLLEEARTDAGTIKQVFVFTHNVYFHKEVCFKKNRPTGGKLKEETFWTVRKPAQQSQINSHDSNPIKTSYELLWLEVRNPDRSNLAIQNTLRRIIENYFKILGGVDPDSICKKFEGRARLICKSLFSWVNDGSHFAQDDLYVSLEEGAVDSYLEVFKAIFEKTDHHSHYNMMMNIEETTNEEKNYLE